MTRDIDALDDDDGFGFCIDCDEPLSRNDLHDLCRDCIRERQLDETEFAMDDEDY